MTALGLTPLDFDSFSYILKGDAGQFAYRVIPVIILPLLYCLAIDILLIYKP